MLHIVRDHPGLTGRAFAGLMWPHLRIGGRQSPPRLAAEHLRILKNRGLVRIKYTCDPFKGPARCIYYLSRLGWEVCEYYRRNP